MLRGLLMAAFVVESNCEPLASAAHLPTALSERVDWCLERGVIGCSGAGVVGYVMERSA